VVNNAIVYFLTTAHHDNLQYGNAYAITI